jgi:hypothetical protein
VATAPMIVAPQLVYAAPAPGIYPAAYGTPVY